MIRFAPLAVLLLTFGCAPKSQATFRGRVVDQKGRSLRGVLVQIVRIDRSPPQPTGVEAYSGRDGRFAIRVPAEADIGWNAVGHQVVAPKCGNLYFLPGQDGPEFDIVIK